MKKKILGMLVFAVIASVLLTETSFAKVGAPSYCPNKLGACP
jgi:hypothetical protein